MHSAEIWEEAEHLVGEDGPSTPAYESLNYHQRMAVMMLSRGASLNQIQVELGKSARTIQYWLAKPNFRQALREATDAQLKEASGALHGRCLKAITRLETIASDFGEPATARVAACRALVTLTLRIAETVERNDQVASLREEIACLLAALRSARPSQDCKILQESAIPLPAPSTPSPESPESPESYASNPSYPPKAPPYPPKAPP